MGTEGAALTGAFGPGRLPVDAELVYVRADRPGDALGHAGRMRAEGSLPAVVAEARAMAVGGVYEPGEPDPQPDDLLLALFPQVDPSGKGIVSAAWLAARERDRRPYPFLRRHDAADGSVIWVFSDLVLRSKDGKVEEVAA